MSMSSRQLGAYRKDLEDRWAEGIGNRAIYTVPDLQKWFDKVMNGPPTYSFEELEALARNPFFEKIAERPMTVIEFLDWLRNHPQDARQILNEKLGEKVVYE